MGWNMSMIFMEYSVNIVGKSSVLSNGEVKKTAKMKVRSKERR
jgi:hypothetical protein